jgi:hypothetical protein
MECPVADLAEGRECPDRYKIIDMSVAGKSRCVAGMAYIV